MLRGAIRPRAIEFNAVLESFVQVLSQTWRDQRFPRRLGLAISGGVDSMALASLCHDYRSQRPRDLLLTGLIVDHGLRKGSGEEAAKVADELDRLQIEPRVLKLDWSEYGDPATLSNLETAARRLRYQALGRACVDDGIESLLVAHHADDQAETVLFRMLRNYLGFGLQGIKPTAAIPETQGLYGVHKSGNLWQPVRGPETQGRSRLPMAIEAGGVTLHRPLLSFSKADLISTCRNANVKWFEDPTNTDSSLTMRNTIRHLQHRGVFPPALTRPRLCDLATSLRVQKDEIEKRTQQTFDRMRIQLNTQQGLVTIEVTKTDLTSTSPLLDHHINAELCRKVLSLVSPVQDISLQDVGPAFKRIFPTENAVSKDVRPKNCIAMVSIGEATVPAPSVPSRQQFCKVDAMPRRYILHRQSPYRPGNLEKVYFTLQAAPTVSSVAPTSPSWSDWLLWDNRYWVRVGFDIFPPPTDVRYYITFLSPKRLGALRKSLDESFDAVRKSALYAKLNKETPLSLRNTLPALGIERDGVDDTTVALPSLRWARTGWKSWLLDEAEETQVRGCSFWEIRYKSVELKQTDMHTII